MQQLSAAVVSLSLLACSRGSSDAPEKQPEPTPTVAPAPAPSTVTPVTPVTATPVLPTSAPGPAYVLTSTGVAYLLADGTEGLIPGRFERITQGADGEVYATSTSADSLTASVVRIEGTKVVSPVKSKLRIDRLHVTKDGVVHVAAGEKVASWDGKAWTEADAGVGSIAALRSDPAGVLWAFGSSEAASRSGTTWTKSPIDQLSKTGGTVGSHFLFTTYEEVKELRDGKLESFGPHMGESVSAFAASASGLAVAIQTPARSSTDHKVWLLDAKGASLSKDLTVGFVVLDDAARLWSFDDGILTVTPLLAGEKTVYPLGTLRALEDYEDSHFLDQRAVIVGAGPTLPPVPEARVATSVKGVLQVGGAAVKNAPVEICVESWILTAGAEPCSEKPSQKSTTTNDKGEFTFENVPLGRYDLGMQIDGKWSVDRSSPIRGLAAGKSKNVGTIRYEK